jgi:hypothetical protein
MKEKFKVECVVLKDSKPPEGVQYIGGKKQDGTVFKHSKEDAINNIEVKKDNYEVNVGDKTAQVVVATNEGRKYLKTSLDKERENNLLSLPKCPG